mmetsp:Transcript_13782/g.33380  ORF Transcript_13782/g.33380 Transcript_13782/m.33380 type:complete len:203 (-) Transcript_13782:874-1482(-)
MWQNNDATCTATGFLIQFSWSGMLYYNMLSFYFLFKSRYGMSNTFIGKRIEPFMHIVSVGYPLLTGIVGAVWGMYSETSASFGCWVNEYPRGCTDEYKSVIIGWIFYGIPFGISSLSLAFNNIAIFIFVRNQTKSRRTSLHSGTTTRTTDNIGNDGEEKLDDLVDNLPSQALRVAVDNSVAENPSQKPDDRVPLAIAANNDT